ncbi:MAG: HAMP domain-containing sensor histidine kinase [Rhodospirillaceae bacterium]
MLKSAVQGYKAFSRSEIRTIEQVEFTRHDMERQKIIAERANQAKTDFLSNISHGLRTPLNAIIRFSSALQTGVYGRVDHPRQAEILADINASGNHLLSLINDILDLSATQAERIKLAKDPVDIAAIIRESARLMKADAAISNVGISVSVAVPSPLVIGDARRLKQILLNLVSNAIKFMLPGGQVTIGTAKAPGSSLSVDVKDTGIGMTAEDVAVARDRFGQASNHLLNKRQGTGLGLPPVAGRARLHGAAFDIASKPDKGTRVRMVFPAKRMIWPAPDGERIGYETYDDAE